MLADNGQMTGSLYKGASSEAQGDQHAVKTALIFYYSIWPTIAILGEPLGQIPNNTSTFVIIVLFRYMNCILGKNHFVDVCALAA